MSCQRYLGRLIGIETSQLIQNASHVRSARAARHFQLCLTAWKMTAAIPCPLIRRRDDVANMAEATSAPEHSELRSNELALWPWGNGIAIGARSCACDSASGWRQVARVMPPTPAADTSNSQRGSSTYWWTRHRTIATPAAPPLPHFLILSPAFTSQPVTSSRSQRHQASPAALTRLHNCPSCVEPGSGCVEWELTTMEGIIPGKGLCLGFEFLDSSRSIYR